MKPFCTITMQPLECRVILGLHGNSIEGFVLKNLCCLEASLKNRPMNKSLAMHSRHWLVSNILLSKRAEKLIFGLY